MHSTGMRVKQKAVRAGWTDKLTSDQPTTTGAPTTAAAQGGHDQLAAPPTAQPAHHQPLHHAAGASSVGKRGADAAQLPGGDSSPDAPAAKRQATTVGGGGAAAAAADVDMPDAPAPVPAAAATAASRLTLAQLLEQLGHQPSPSNICGAVLKGWAQQAGVSAGAPVAVLFQHTQDLLGRMDSLTSSDPSRLPQVAMPQVNTAHSGNP